MSDKPKVEGYVTTTKTVDFTAALDGWTVEEIDMFLAGDDDEGTDYLISDAYVIGVDSADADYRKKDLVAYAEWRRSSGQLDRVRS